MSNQRKARHKAAGLLLAACVFLLCPGCKNQINMNERMLIQGIALDMDGSGYTATVQISQAKEGQEGKARLIVASGQSVMDAVNNATLQVGKRPLYSHNMIVLLGRQVAEEGLDKVLDFFVRWQECRSTVGVFMAEDRADSLLNVQVDEKPILAKEIDALSKGGAWSGEAIRQEVLDVYNNLYDEGASPMLPILRANETSVSVEGMAVFSDGQLTGTIDPEGVRGFLLASGKLENGVSVVDIEKAGRITLNITHADSKIVSKIANGIPSFDVEISLKATLAAIDSKEDLELGQDYYDKFESALEHLVKEQVQESIRLCMKEYRSDVFDFGRTLMKQQTDFWRANSGNWEQLKDQCDYNVNIKAEVTRVGQEITPGLHLSSEQSS